MIMIIICSHGPTDVRLHRKRGVADGVSAVAGFLRRVSDALYADSLKLWPSSTMTASSMIASRFRSTHARIDCAGIP